MPALLLLTILPLTLCGPGDTLDQLRSTITNVRISDQVYREPVVTVSGAPPHWLSGSFIRHACGVYGETRHPSDTMVNRVTHMFDCIEMGQSYTFHQGHVTFTSQYYDTNRVDIWARYQENMNTSSIFWGTVYAERNVTAMDLEHDNYHKPGKPGEIPAVSWWQLGDDVVAMTEHPGGYIVDVHHVEAVESYPYNDNGWTGDYSIITSPAHEAYGPDGVVWSTAGAFNYATGQTKVMLKYELSLII